MKNVINNSSSILSLKAGKYDPRLKGGKYDPRLKGGKYEVQSLYFFCFGYIKKIILKMYREKPASPHCSSLNKLSL